MTDPDLSPAERLAQEAVKTLARPRADAAFRARLRHEFVSGRFGRRAGLAAERPGSVRSALWAPVAASVLVATFLVANRGPDWQVLAPPGAGRMTVDGVAYDVARLTPAEGDAMRERLRRGARVQIEGGTLDLLVPGVIAISLSPGADVTLSPGPNRWVPRDLTAEVAHGNAYFSTGRKFHGASLDVRTPEGSVRAVGTSFAVLCGPGETCVCVMEGRVRVAAGTATMANGVDVPHGMRRVLHDGKAETLPILDDSVAHLHRQIMAAGDQLGR